MDQKTTENFAENVRRFRDLAKLSQSEAGAVLQPESPPTRKTVRDWEEGKRTPNNKAVTQRAAEQVRVWEKLADQRARERDVLIEEIGAAARLMDMTDLRKTHTEILKRFKDSVVAERALDEADQVMDDAERDGPRSGNAAG